MLSRNELLREHCIDLHEKDKLVKLMYKIDPERAAEISDCGLRITVYEDQITGRTFKEYSGFTCGDRFCPICQRRRSRKLCRRAAEKLDDYIKDYSNAYVVQWTFSPVENCDISELRTVFHHFSVFLHAMLSEPASPFPAPDGYIRSYEFTISEEDNKVHPHIHMLCLYPDYVYFDKAAINNYIIKVMKRKSCGNRVSSGICRFDVKRNCKTGKEDSFDITTESVKYVTKFSEIRDEYTLSALIGQIKGCQTIRFCGCMGWSKEDEESYQQRKIDEMEDSLQNCHFVQTCYSFIPSFASGSFMGYLPVTRQQIDSIRKKYIDTGQIKNNSPEKADNIDNVYIQSSIFDF